MKILILLVSLSLVMSGCATKKVVVVPAGASIMFQTEGDASDFRAATLLDPKNIGRVVRLTEPLKVVR